MAQLAQQGSQDLKVRSQAIDLTQRLKQKDFLGEAKACLEFCRDHIRYVRDIRGVETLHYPATILAMQCGDCDDKAILLSALLQSIGHKTRFIAVSLRPGTWDHVWLQVLVHGKWIDLEPTEPIQFGERIPARGVLDVMYWEV